MTKTVIQVNNLSKRYRIGLKEKRHDTFAQQIIATLKAPITNFRQLRSMSKFGAEDESVFWALKDINFEVKEGEVLGIIGHNGAGKSTLLKILSRITEPTSGEIKIKGRISALLEVGTGFHPDLTGRENVYMNGTILGMTKREIDAKFDEIVDFSGVEKYIDTPVKFYSSGMKVRLGFAVAAHLEPEILIIDEVLAVGDAEFQQKCLGKMHDVAENEGRTVLFVSHNLLAIRSLCGSCAYLDKGILIHKGDVNEVVDLYLSNVGIANKIGKERGKSQSGNDFVQVTEVDICSELADGRFEITTPIKIKVRLINKKLQGKINVNLFFNTLDGTNIFAITSSLFDTPEFGKEIEVTYLFPSNLFNDMVYLIDVMVVKNGESSVYLLRNALSIEGIEPPRNGGWLGKYPGVIRPKIKFEIK